MTVNSSKIHEELAPYRTIQFHMFCTSEPHVSSTTTTITFKGVENYLRISKYIQLVS